MLLYLFFNITKINLALLFNNPKNTPAATTLLINIILSKDGRLLKKKQISYLKLALQTQTDVRKRRK